MLDILIPMYNNEEYIKACIESIKNQTFKDFKVYIIDDGSKDNSFMAASTYADERFVIKRRENKGVSSTRQELLDISSGEYIMFIDSDDYLPDNYVLEKMFNKFIETDSDIIISGISKNVNGKIVNNRILDQSEETVGTKQALEDLFYIKYNGPTLLGTIFKRKVFKDIKFVPGIIYEDAEIMYKIILNAKKITYFNINSYVYNIRENSIMRKQISCNNMILLDISNIIKNEIIKVYPELEEAAIYSLVNNSLELLRLKVLSPQKFDDKKKIISEIKKYKSNILNNPHSRKGKKIQVIAASLGELPYKMLILLYVRILKKY